MFSTFRFQLTKQEVKEYEDKGYIAVKNASYIRGDKHCQITGWIVWVKGKGFVKNYYATKYAALTAAESDDERTEVYGREYTQADVDKCRQGSLLRSRIEYAFAHRMNLQ